MDGLRDYHTKWIKSDRERQISYDITYMCNLTYDTNELIYKTEVNSYQEFGINRYIPLYIKQVNNKDVLYSTGNYMQYLLITYNGKESEKEKIYMYICIDESLCCTPETL